MAQHDKSSVLIQKPNWLKRRLPTGPAFETIKGMISRDGLHTVCEEAKCPNIWECYSHKTATFLILGSNCSRSCRFCSVPGGDLEPPDPQEPARVARVAREMGLKYVVITSVTRDDLVDGGAGIFAATIREIRHHIPQVRIEVLIPDFQGSKDALQTVLKAEPNVLNHNIETVPRLYPRVRPEADYRRSLDLIHQANAFNPQLPTKSGLMLGLGESSKEIAQTLADLRQANCRILTLGQYLQPSKDHLAVERYVPPDEFEAWRKEALAMGFAEVASGPFVRSSYHAHDLFEKIAV